MSLLVRRRMESRAASPEKTLQLLASYTISGSEHSITIPATDAMRSCETLYLKFDNVSISIVDWLYVGANTVSFTGDNLGYLAKANQFNDVYPICRTKTSDMSSKTQKSYMAMFASEKTTPREKNTFTNLLIVPYTSSVIFTTGTIEIWGWI